MKTVVILTLMIMATSIKTEAQSAHESTSDATNKFEVVVKDVEGFSMLYYEFTGPYMKSFDDFENLMSYIQKGGLAMGPHAVGVFYDDPAEVPEEKLRSEAGYMIAGEIVPSDGYKFKKIPAGKAVTVKYNSIEEIYPAYEAIAKYIQNNNLQTESFSIEVYLSNDPNVMDAEIRMMLK